jgi:hypothetical protein
LFIFRALLKDFIKDEVLQDGNNNIVLVEEHVNNDLFASFIQHVIFL